jgi:hypothetical protein
MGEKDDHIGLQSKQTLRIFETLRILVWNLRKADDIGAVSGSSK